MEFKELVKKAKKVREEYLKIEMGRFGRERTKEQIFQGFIGDVGDLAKLLIAADGVSEKHADLGQDEIKEKIAHELSDCLYCVIILADKYDINLEKSFVETMEGLEKKISKL